MNNLNGWYKTIDRVTHALAAKPKLYIADIKVLWNKPSSHLLENYRLEAAA